MPGLEGSCADARLWDQARKRFLRIPQGKFLLGDAGFPLNDSCLVPFRNTRYHMKDWSTNADLRPKNYQELFNLRHSSARNVIERIFGVVKNRFAVFSRGCMYPIQFQVKVVVVMALIHNLIRKEEPNNMDGQNEADDQNNDELYTPSQSSLHSTGIRKQESSRASQLRDQIAQQMWSDNGNMM